MGSFDVYNPPTTYTDPEDFEWEKHGDLSTRQKSKNVNGDGRTAVLELAFEGVQAETKDGEGSTTVLLERDGLLLVEPKSRTEGPKNGDGEEDQEAGKYVGVGDMGLL